MALRPLRWACVVLGLLTAGCDGEPAAPTVAPFGVLTADGGRVELPAAGAGRPTAVVFWTSWCAPCRQELAQVQTLADQGGGALAVFAVNVGEDRAVAAAALAAAGVRFPLLRDPDGESARALGVVSYPHLLLFGRDGRLRHRVAEPVTSAALRRLLADLE